jgi:hypothetical protein
MGRAAVWAQLEGLGLPVDLFDLGTVSTILTPEGAERTRLSFLHKTPKYQQLIFVYFC